MRLIQLHQQCIVFSRHTDIKSSSERCISSSPSGGPPRAVAGKETAIFPCLLSHAQKFLHLSHQLFQALTPIERPLSFWALTRPAETLQLSWFIFIFNLQKPGPSSYLLGVRRLFRWYLLAHQTRPHGNKHKACEVSLIGVLMEILPHDK